MYGRFRDDVLVIAADIWKCQTWLVRLREYTKPVFIIELVDLSSVAIEMLAVKILVRGSALHTVAKPPRSLGPPLSVRSAHPRHFLLSWPFAYLLPALRLCSNEKLAKVCFDDCFQRLVKYHEPAAFVELVRSQVSRALLRRFGDLFAAACFTSKR